MSRRFHVNPYGDYDEEPKDEVEEELVRLWNRVSRQIGDGKVMVRAERIGRAPGYLIVEVEILTPKAEEFEETYTEKLEELLRKRWGVTRKDLLGELWKAAVHIGKKLREAGFKTEIIDDVEVYSVGARAPDEKAAHEIAAIIRKYALVDPILRFIKEY